MLKKTITFLIVLAVFSAVFYKISFAPEKSAEENNLKATSTPVADKVDDTIKVGGIEFRAIEEKVEKPSVPAPSLDEPIVLPQRFTAEIRQIEERRIKDIILKLEKDPLSFDLWNELALEKQSIDDYEGAKEIWNYTALLKPKDPLSFSNLGNLYGFYLKDNIKAEENYLKSIELGQNNGFWYYQTFIFYKDALKDDVKAKAIIEEGVKNNPNDEDLKNILNSL